jgi:ATPase family AAA domain-containing protein 3A/B
LLFSRRQAWAAEAEEKRTEAISSLARIAAKGEEDRAKMRAAIGAFFQALADALASVLVQSGSWGFALAILSFSLAILLARHGMGLLSQLLEHWLTRPSLIRDTSRMNFCAEFVAAIFLRSFGGRRDAKQRASAGEGLGPGVILGVAEEQRLLEVVSAVRGAQEHGVELQHLLLSGAPGTGKTMVARRLADLCDLDYAILSGADLGPLGTRAAAEVHRLMAWAQSSPRGMLLLIDEAEAIAPSRRRRSVRLGEAAVGALNALMYNTGAVGSRFMLVMATSRPEDLDEGILDRMDHAVELSLPGSADRLRLCKYYFSLYFTGQGPARRNRNFFGSRRARPIVCAPDWDADVALADLAGRSEGLSGREVDKILLAVQAAVYGTEDCTLTGELWRLVIERQLANAKAKKALQNGEDPEAAAPMDQEPEVVPLRSSPSPESTATRTRSRRVCVHIF